MQGNRPRRPGELVFNLVMVVGSAALLWSAYGISGFEALSSPGAIPMVASGIMLVCAALILWDTVRRPRSQSETLERDILPIKVVGTIALVAAYALVLKPLGFLPTSFLFLTLLIRFLAGSNLMRAALIAFVSVLVIWLVFRLVFTVLMPPGVVPEAEIIAWVKALFAGKGE